MKADPKMASQTTNISFNAIYMFFSFVYSVCLGLLMLQVQAVPSRGSAQMISNAQNVMGISLETIWLFTNAPNGHYSKVQDLKNHPATIKNTWINKRWQRLPSPYWIRGWVEESELRLLCGWYSVQITHLYSFPFSHDEPYWEQL